MITNGGIFQIYVGRLEDYFSGEVQNANIESAEYWFGEKTGKIVMGTSHGKLLVYDTETKELESEVRIGGVN